jgi:hypothetical protein
MQLTAACAAAVCLRATAVLSPTREECMKVRLVSTLALTVALVLGVASPALAGSYRSRIEQYVDARPEQAYMVQTALQQAGWGYTTPAEKSLVRQAILVTAGESGMNPANTGNPYCDGLFQIQGGKAAYGRWTAAELADPATRAKYTLVGQPWRFGMVRTYANGRYLGVENGWYIRAGRSGGHPSDWSFGPVRVYENEHYIGDRVGWYRAAPVTYATPRVGEYKIFNPVFNSEVALRMYGSRGWQPWSVARKLGLR